MIPPPPAIGPMWSDNNESVKSFDGRIWRIRDLRTVVAGQPVFDLPLGAFPFADHEFVCKDLIEFARHMLHVNRADLSYPVIMDERGRVIDGRHRLVKALLEGRESVPCVKIPEGVNPSATEN